MSNVERLIASELDRMLPLPEGSRADWSEVLRRADIASARHWWSGRPASSGRVGRRRWRSVLVAVAAVAALVGAGIAIAAGFGAFNGISAAQHPRTAADRLDPAVVAQIEKANKARPQRVTHGLGQLEPDSSRLVKQLPDGARVYVLSTTTGRLCVLLERAPASNAGKGGASVTGCGWTLTQKLPSTVLSFKANEKTPTLNWGITLDNVAAVSFKADGHDVTVPVVHNVWVYEGNSAVYPLTVHFQDGRIETLP